MSALLGIVAGTPIGEALAFRLREDGRPPREWRPPAGTATTAGELEELGKLARACELIVVDAEPEALPQIARALGEVVDGGHRLAHTVRGFVDDAMAAESGESGPRGERVAVTASELLRRETAVRRIGVIAGPLAAADLRAGRPTAAVVASRHPEVVDEFTAALSTPRLRVYRGRDPLGAELGQSLIDLVGYSVGLGDGLGFGEATRALLIVRSVRELGRLIAALGGEAATASGLAGLGAILVHSTSAQNEAYRLGVAAATRPSGEVAPSPASAALLRTARTLRDLGRRQRVAVHLLDGLARLLEGGLTASDVVQALMAIPVLDD